MWNNTDIITANAEKGWRYGSQTSAREKNN